MSSRSRKLSLLLVLAVGLTTAAAGAQDGRDATWWVFQDLVIDSKFDQYLDARKEIVALLHKDRISSSEFAVVAMESQGAACVVYSSPVSFGGSRDASELSVDWDAVFAQLGPEYVDAWNRMREATRVSSEYLIRYRPDLSFTPGNERLSPEEQGYIRSEQYYLEPASQAGFEEVLAQRRALYRQHAIDNGYRVFEVVVGPEVPAFMMAYGGRSAEDLDAALARDRVVLGAAGEALDNRARLLTRKIENHIQRLRLDLSYFPQ